ncbi:MAG: hypothetical protein ACYDCY_10425 [Metallibacterium sp.]
MHSGTYLIIAIVAGLVLFRLYRRGRNLIGEQAYSEKTMRRRLVVLAVVLALLLFDDWNLSHAAFVHAGSALILAAVYLVAGVACGAVLGIWAARLTHLRWHDGALKLRGHVYIGPAILALYVLRLIYRFWLMQHLGLMNASAYDPAHAMVMQREMAEYVLNPVSSLLRGLVFAYYFTYYPLLMRRARAMQAAAPVAVADQP